MRCALGTLVLCYVDVVLDIVCHALDETILTIIVVIDYESGQTICAYEIVFHIQQTKLISSQSVVDTTAR